MDVILLRHGPAGEADPAQWPDDHDRPLTMDGRERVRRAAETLRTLDAVPTRIVASAAARAWATAEIVASELCLEAPEAWPELLPEADAAPVAARLRALGKGAVLVVGHQPTLEELASLLLTGSPSGCRVHVDKAGLVGVRLRRDGGAELRFVVPKRLLGDGEGRP